MMINIDIPNQRAGIVAITSIIGFLFGILLFSITTSIVLLFIFSLMGFLFSRISQYDAETVELTIIGSQLLLICVYVVLLFI